jgi:hypothetical protein
MGELGLWLTASSWILGFVFSAPALLFLLPIPSVLCPLGLVLGSSVCDVNRRSARGGQ